MFTCPENLDELTDTQLYDLKDALSLYRSINGRGRSPDAAQARWFCKEERARVSAELRRRGAPGTRPGDTRSYGPGTAAWQRAGKAV